MTSMKYGFTVLCVCMALGVFAQKVDKEYVGIQVMQGNEYTLLLLKNTGKPFPKDSIDGWRMQHLIGLFQWHADRKTSVFGPVTEPSSDIAGIIVFNTNDTAKVKTMIEGDPFVRNGIFTYQLYPWFSIPGQTLLPAEKKKP